jgi:plastocyanin/mono/diheme cytochrome c family protein
VGSVQRMATVVIVGLVTLSTILFLYLGDEDNRIKTEAAEQQETSIERGRDTFISLCLPCHGPAGEGYTEPGAAGTGRIGAALGGINTSLNQEGINSQGTPVAGGVAARTTTIHNTIVNGLKNPDGTYRMPAFSSANGGPLNDEQINELVLLIQHGDWNTTYNAAIEASGGYPTPPPAPGAGATATAQAEAGGSPAAVAPSEGSGGETAQEVTITMHDIYFDPAELTIPANTPVKVILPNQGAAVHDFSIDALGIAVTVNPGETGEVVINAPAGEYEFYCNIPGHKDAGMVGKLTVEEGAGGSAAPPPASGEEATPAPAASGGEAPAAESPVITMHDIYFDPAEFTLPANTPVKVSLPNEGAAVHDFSIDALGISVTVNPGETGEVEINAPAGEYEFYCNIPGHKEAGMVGKLTVQ